jgi:hypothetical protein
VHRSEWRGIHAARHAGIHALLDRDLGTCPRAVTWKRVVEAEDRQPKSLRPGLEVAIATGQIIAGEALRRIADVRPDMSVGRGDEITATPHQAAVAIVGQSANFGHGPDRIFRRRRGLAVTLHR